MKLHRFWIQFKNPPRLSSLSIGCGVTAWNHLDAIAILNLTVLLEHPDLIVDSAKEDVDVRELNTGHVLPNMGILSNRGVWFPLGYQIDEGLDSAGQRGNDAR